GATPTSTKAPVTSVKRVRVRSTVRRRPAEVERHHRVAIPIRVIPPEATAPSVAVYRPIGIQIRSQGQDLTAGNPVVRFRKGLSAVFAPKLHGIAVFLRVRQFRN